MEKNQTGKHLANRRRMTADLKVRVLLAKEVLVKAVLVNSHRALTVMMR